MKSVKVRAAVLALSSVLLAGCFEDRPSDAVAEPVVRRQAETDLVDGLAIVDFKRDNGQLDPDSVNRYKVTYTYRLQLTKPCAEVVLGVAQDLYQEWQAASKQTGLMAMQGSLERMQYGMAAGQWISAQGDSFPARRDAFVGSCARCLAFWNSEDAPEQADDRRTAYILAWDHLAQRQFEDGFNVGDGVDRHAWHYFVKTEKGWMAH